MNNPLAATAALIKAIEYDTGLVHGTETHAPLPTVAQLVAYKPTSKQDALDHLAKLAGGLEGATTPQDANAVIGAINAVASEFFPEQASEDIPTVDGSVPVAPQVHPFDKVVKSIDPNTSNPFEKLILAVEEYVSCSKVKLDVNFDNFGHFTINNPCGQPVAFTASGAVKLDGVVG